MAAYAALTSLMHVVKQIQEYGQRLILLNPEHIESLGQKVGFLQKILEIYSDGGSEEAEIMENQIADAAYAAEDAIESHVVEHILAGTHCDLNSSSATLCNLDEAIENLDTIKRRVEGITKENQRFVKVQKPEYDPSMPASSSRSSDTGNITVVGLDEELLRVMDWLTGGNRARQIMSIVGMGGIGKTTLARSVYEKTLIVKHFDIRIWVTVSQQYNRHKILLAMVLCLKGNESSEVIKLDENQLGQSLHQNLSGRKYLVVMDDMWSVEAWDMVRFFLPDNGNGSRVVVTTRQSKMATHFGPCCLKMDFLDKDRSWDLFCERVFGQESCPIELEEMGKVIADKCKGLPLSIVVTAGLLANSSRTREYWENASENLNSSARNSGDDEYCMKILSQSYNYLPTHLKPCFLYISLFPEDHEIRISQLVGLWVAEGFLKLNGSKSPEEVAEGYLLDLVDRNLILVGRRRRNGCIKTCKIHDLLRDLCLRIVHQGRFLCPLNMSSHEISQDADMERRIVVYDPEMDNASFSPTRSHRHKLVRVLKSASCCRSLLFDYDKHYRLSSSMLMRVLSTSDAMFSPGSAFELVNLRYLSFMPNWFGGFVDHYSFSPSIPSTLIPSTIASLWNVQTIICRGMDNRFVLPSEFWSMLQLKHVVFDEVCLLDTPSNRPPECFVLENLETLSNVAKFRCDEEIVKILPNLKKLKISYYNISKYYNNGSSTTDDVQKVESINSLAGSYSNLKSLDCLARLESLNLCFHGSPQLSDLLQNITYPCSLKKLTLIGTYLQWADLSTVGSLPALNVLVLDIYSVVGSEWNPIEGEFPCLKFLRIYNSKLEHFDADERHFPALEDLVLEYMSSLDEVPLGIAYIQTLKSIDLYLCSDSAVMSSKNILEEQEGLGNEDTRVQVTFKNRKELNDFMVNMELESFASDRLQVKVDY